ncbi:hypothetical protein [Paracoccus mangrovi]|uniref:hypothetical protein n=1 Tax=Paracoccus mangrovi TaxID=1715645 RepID=UPI00367094B2
MIVPPLAGQTPPVAKRLPIAYPKLVLIPQLAYCLAQDWHAALTKGLTAPRKTLIFWNVLTYDD